MKCPRCQTENPSQAKFCLAGVRVVSRLCQPNLWNPAVHFCLEQVEAELRELA
jgi:hypothetical protein